MMHTYWIKFIIFCEHQVLLKKEFGKKGVIILDTKNYNIICKDEDIFIGIKFLSPYDNSLLKTNKDYGFAETTKITDTLTFRKSQIFNYNWYAEFDNGIFIPRQNNKQAEQIINNKKSKSDNSINLLVDIEYKILEK